MLAKKVTMPEVLMPLGSAAAASTVLWNAVVTCPASSVAIIGKPPRVRYGGYGHAAVLKPFGNAHIVLPVAHHVE
ncbi:hypothetical protein Apa02nite_051530 [Actinoplanes palleronii]|uniref:Secreted protein n=1 Tax=Actinoplanes palleronii TaxID=113570 RepID=A0ABQ4BEP5_9ACTN|nr:hypothetical protein Apa02nite_051530 [Actinoplanes palleronii]